MTGRTVDGAMAGWSDLDGRHGPGPVRGAAFAPLLATAHGRTLVAGPHDPALIDALTVTDLTLLVRGLPDADLLATRYADRTGITIRCGTPETLGGEPPFDTIVALDGLARLSSVEGAELTWADACDLLFTVLRPGGQLLIAVENFAGTHRLAAGPQDLTDSDWMATGGYDPTRPAGLRQVIARLTGAGYRGIRAYAAYPTPIAPAALLGPEILADEDRRGFVAATVSRACPAAAGGWTDPARVAIDAARHGLAADLAPGWIIVADRDPASDREVAPGSSASADRTALVIAAGGRPLALPDGVIAPGTEPHVIAVAAVPAGRTLEDHMIEACLRRDLPALRELIDVWQSGPDAGVDADQVIASPDFRSIALAPAGDPDAAVRAFATTLVRNGFAHPWAAATDADGIATAIAAMLGRDFNPAPTDRPGHPPVRELVIERDRLTLALAEANAKLAWYEKTLAARDDTLRRAQHLIELLSARGPARAGKALMGGAKAARRTARVVLRGIRERP
jgi:hypothetical protein